MTSLLGLIITLWLIKFNKHLSAQSINKKYANAVGDREVNMMLYLTQESWQLYCGIYHWAEAQ